MLINEQYYEHHLKSMETLGGFLVGGTWGSTSQAPFHRLCRQENPTSFLYGRLRLCHAPMVPWVRVLKRTSEPLAALGKRTAEGASGSRVGKGTGKGCWRLNRDTDFMIVVWVCESIWQPSISNACQGTQVEGRRSNLMLVLARVSLGLKSLDFVTWQYKYNFCHLHYF